MPIPVRCLMGMSMLKWRSWHPYSYLPPNGNEHAEREILAYLFLFAKMLGRMGMSMLKGRSWHAYSYSQLIPVGPNRNEDAEMEILASLFLFAATVGD